MNRKLQCITEKVKKIKYHANDLHSNANIILKTYLEKNQFSRTFKELLNVSRKSTNNIRRNPPKRPLKINESQRQKKTQHFSEERNIKRTQHFSEERTIKKTKIYTKNKVFNDVSDMLTGYIISVPKNNFDSYSEIYLKSLDNQLCVIPKNKVINHLKHIKYKVVEHFNKNNLYKIYNFSSKDFKKSDIDDVFANNKKISKAMLKIYGRVFNTNIIYIHPKHVEFMTNFIPTKVTFLITEDDSHLYSVRVNKSAFIRGEELVDIFKINRVFQQDVLQKFKLDVLQNLCNMKNIDYRKIGKTKKINKTKDEIIKELCNV